jgi:tRNA-splicing ligase RtcB
MHFTREVFEKFFKNSWQNMNMHLVYDVAHNIAKFEMHKIDGKDKKLCVHRKGATRALPAGHVNLPLKYKTTGQPVIIPGDMGRCSYLLAGLPQAEDTFYSSCHGAGRIMSRSAAVKKLKGISVSDELEKKGIYVMADKKSTLAEEAPQAYKNVDNVVDVIERASICRKICKMKPLAVIKG